MANESNENKRFYWMKLRDNFFGELTTLALRKLPDGDSVCLIYLKLLLYAMKTEGHIYYEGVFDSLEAELSAILGEDESVVGRCIEAVVKFKLAERRENELYLFAVEQYVGSETDAAKRMRESRQKKNADENISSEQCSNNVQPDANIVQGCYTEKREKIKENRVEIKENRESGANKFAVPSLAEVEAYCKERKNSIDPAKWLEYYNSNGFMVGKTHMKDWRAAIRLWERRELEQPTYSAKNSADYSSPENYGTAW